VLGTFTLVSKIRKRCNWLWRFTFEYLKRDLSRL